MIRRGAAYGPGLPEDAPDDGVERDIAAFIICASLVRQFEFAQNVWINDKSFHELGNERDPMSVTRTAHSTTRFRIGPSGRFSKGCPLSPPSRGGAYFSFARPQRPALPHHTDKLRNNDHERLSEPPVT